MFMLNFDNKKTICRLLLSTATFLRRKEEVGEVEPRPFYVLFFCSYGYFLGVTKYEMWGFIPFQLRFVRKNKFFQVYKKIGVKLISEIKLSIKSDINFDNFN